MSSTSHVPKTSEEAAAAAVRAASDADVQRVKLHERVDRDFRYHAPKPDQLPKYEELRTRFRELAHLMVDLVPPGRELSRALSSLEDAVMQANAGIARNG